MALQGIIEQLVIERNGSGYWLAEDSLDWGAFARHVGSRIDAMDFWAIAELLAAWQSKDGNKVKAGFERLLR